MATNSGQGQMGQSRLSLLCFIYGGALKQKLYFSFFVTVACLAGVLIRSSFESDLAFLIAALLLGFNLFLERQANFELDQLKTDLKTLSGRIDSLSLKHGMGR